MQFWHSSLSKYLLLVTRVPSALSGIVLVKVGLAVACPHHFQVRTKISGRLVFKSAFRETLDTVDRFSSLQFKGYLRGFAAVRAFGLMHPFLQRLKSPLFPISRVRNMSKRLRFEA